MPSVSLLTEALATLGEVLAQRDAPQEVVVIGGSGLLLLGAVQRATRDVDLVALLREGHLISAAPLPAILQEAADDVARALGLSSSWFSGAPTALLDFGLPPGFLSRCHARRFAALVVHFASRFDQIHLKLHAAADQGPRSKHMSDLRALTPAPDELLAAARWCRTHDPSQGFLAELCGALTCLGMEVDDADF